MKAKNEKGSSQLTQANDIDQLTGLKNRQCFTLDLTLHALEAGRKGEVFSKSYLCLDIENFQAYLDFHGYGVSDELLISIAHKLQAAFSGQNIYRVGGDEFVVEDVATFPAALSEGWPVTLKHAIVKIETSVEKGRHHRATSWMLLHIQQGIVCSSSTGEVIHCSTRE